MEAIVTAMNRVNGITSVKWRCAWCWWRIMTWVDTRPSHDHTNNSGLRWAKPGEPDAVIGKATMISGTFVLTAGVSLNLGQKRRFEGRGVTGLTNPTGDAFYVDYVAHEMGHQFGAYHTFNGTAGSCSGNRTASAAYEPGSGSTIMAYAGICGTHDLQPHSDAYFHPISYDQIVSFTLGSGNSCAVVTSTGNHAPTIQGGTTGVTIPRNTPFILTGSAVDPDHHSLTYAWDEMDLGPAGAPPPVSGYVVPPHFRSFNPVLSPSRIFPQMADIVNNTITIGEILPSTTRPMVFRFTARDNRSGGGGVDFGTYTINVTSDAPFLVTAPNTALNWYGG
jgi:hypothetical protein